MSARVRLRKPISSSLMPHVSPISSFFSNSNASSDDRPSPQVREEIDHLELEALRLEHEIEMNEQRLSWLLEDASRRGARDEVFLADLHSELGRARQQLVTTTSPAVLGRQSAGAPVL